MATDSPIPIETQYLDKILQGYALIDMGSPVFYSILIDKILHRGLENHYESAAKLTELVKTLNRATNVHKGCFGLNAAVEKKIIHDLHQGRFKGGFVELCKVVENLLPANIGSNEFHLELERFLVVNFTDENLQDIVNLVKGLSTYRIKLKELSALLYGCLCSNIEKFSIKQLEILLWSVSRMPEEDKVKLKLEETLAQSQIDQEEVDALRQKYLDLLVTQVRVKSPSMRPRGVAFAIESLANLDLEDKSVFDRMERVVLAKLDDFIPHYVVKVLSSYYRAECGSGELYDQLIHHILKIIEYQDDESKQSLRYSDMIRFFEIYPEVSHIYENTMSAELYVRFI